MSGQNARRGAGRRQVLSALGDHGPASRVELVRRTGLSSSAVSTLAAELVAEGLLQESAETGRPDVPRGRGRPAYLLSLTPPSGLVVGIDVGNSHVRVAVAAVGGPVLAERAVPLTRADRPEEALGVADELTRKVVEASGRRVDDVRLAVLGVPAPVERTSGRVAANNILPRWVGRRPGVELGESLGLAVAAENDANVGALGEQRHGAGAGAGSGGSSLMYLKLGTGIGAGLVLAGRLYRGDGGTAGEVGHVQVDPAGVLCRCGSRGCLETVVSVPRLLAALVPVTRPDLVAEDLGRLVAEGHPGAVRVVEDAGRTVGKVLAGLITVLNPGLVVLGGHLGPVNALLANGIRVAVDQWAQPAAASKVQVCASDLGDRAEVLGALTLARDRVLEEQRAGLLDS